MVCNNVRPINANLNPAPPPWVGGLHSTHNLFWVGGFAYCRKCGLVTSRVTKGTQKGLHLECKKPLPKGSEWLFSQLDAGKLAVTYWVKKGIWPNGQKAHAVQHVYKIPTVRSPASPGAASSAATDSGSF